MCSPEDFSRRLRICLGVGTAIALIGTVLTLFSVFSGIGDVVFYAGLLFTGFGIGFLVAFLLTTPDPISPVPTNYGPTSNPVPEGWPDR